MANIRVTVEVESEGAPDQVFAYISDPSNMPDWVNGVESASWSEGSDLQPGGKFNLDYKYRGKTSKIVMEITGSDPGRKFEYHTIEGKYPIEVTVELMPSGTGTKIAYTQNALSDSRVTSLAFIVTGWLARPMMRKSLRKDLEKMAESVKCV